MSVIIDVSSTHHQLSFAGGSDYLGHSISTLQARLPSFSADHAILQGRYESKHDFALWPSFEMMTWTLELAFPHFYGPIRSGNGRPLGDSFWRQESILHLFNSVLEASVAVNALQA